MNFKMGSAKDKDSPKDAVAPAPPRPSSSSGIYDISRMTNVKPPMDSYGRSISQVTRSRGVVAKNSGASEMIRGLMVAIALPFSATAAYLIFAGDSVDVSRLTVTNDLPKMIVPLSPAVERSPAAQTALPPILYETPSSFVEPGPVTLDLIRGFGVGPSLKPRPLQLTFSNDGKILSPFSFELDENGLEIARLELNETSYDQPSLTFAPFENSIRLSESSLPETYKGLVGARPFVFTENERSRILSLRRTSGDVSAAINSSMDFSNLQLSKKVFAVSSLGVLTDGASINQANQELLWLRASGLTREVLSDRTFEKRMLDALMLWSNTYRTNGNAIEDGPILYAVFAYSHVRHLWNTKDQVHIDRFFQNIVNDQFLRMKSHKIYDEAHAAHLRLALTVGVVTENLALQLYGLTQYRLHTQLSTALKQETFGPNEVRTLEHLLRTAFVIERSGSTEYRSPVLHKALKVLSDSSQTYPSEDLVNVLAMAAYFRPELYGRVATLSQALTGKGTRFGNSDGALLAAIRRPTTTFDPSSVGARTPTSLPGKLPPKFPKK